MHRYTQALLEALPQPDELSFAPLTRHINAVLLGEKELRLLAVDTALPTAQALHELAASAEQHR